MPCLVIYINLTINGVNKNVPFHDPPGKAMISDAAKEDLETLLHMEIKLRLLEVEGLELPQEPPPIPELPSNFDFSALQINGTKSSPC